MSRVIAVAACGFALAACSMSMPSLDFFRSSPPTEVLRIESEPPGADARIAEGQSCRTPCELTVPATAEVAVSFALAGYQPQTIAVRPEAQPANSFASEAPHGTRMQPNPVYAELQPSVPPRPAKKKRRPRPKKTVAKQATPAPSAAPPPAAAPPPPASSPTPARSPTTATNPADYPWPPPPPN